MVHLLLLYKLNNDDSSNELTKFLRAARAVPTSEKGDRKELYLFGCHKYYCETPKTLMIAIACYLIFLNGQYRFIMSLKHT